MQCITILYFRTWERKWGGKSFRKVGVHGETAETADGCAQQLSTKVGACLDSPLPLKKKKYGGRKQWKMNDSTPQFYPSSLHYKPIILTLRNVYLSFIVLSLNHTAYSFVTYSKIFYFIYTSGYAPRGLYWYFKCFFFIFKICCVWRLCRVKLSL